MIGLGPGAGATTLVWGTAILIINAFLWKISVFSIEKGRGLKKKQKNKKTNPKNLDIGK